MKLYIGNTSKQAHDFIYRVPGENRLRRQNIMPLSQIPIMGTGDMELTSDEVENIVAQHERYGMVRVDEIDRTRAFVGLCYSVDSPIDISRFEYTMEHNDDVLVDLGTELRKEAGVATFNQMENDLTNNDLTLRNVEMSVQEQPTRDGKLSKDKLEQTISVDRGGDESGSKGRRR